MRLITIEPSSSRILQKLFQLIKLLTHILLFEDTQEPIPPVEQGGEAPLAILAGPLHIQEIIEEHFPLDLPPTFVGSSLDPPSASNFDNVIVDVSSEQQAVGNACDTKVVNVVHPWPSLSHLDALEQVALHQDLIKHRVLWKKPEIQRLAEVNELEARAPGEVGSAWDEPDQEVVRLDVGVDDANAVEVFQEAKELCNEVNSQGLTPLYSSSCPSP